MPKGCLATIAPVAAVLAALAGGGTARAEPRVVARHGAWEVRCAEVADAGATGACELLMDLAKDFGEGVDVRAIAVERREGDRLVMRITLVPGIYLPRGVDLMIGGETRIGVPFETCMAREGGCVAEVDAVPLLGALKGGGEITVAFMSDTRDASKVKFAVEGFAEALAALDAAAPPGQAAASNAAGATAASFGAWQKLCRKTDGASEARLCNIVQSAKDDATGSTITVALIAQAGQPLSVRAVVSGSVVLQPGLALAIDGAPQGVVAFDVCSQLGCAVQVGLADVVAARLKAGRTASFTYRIDPDATVAAPIRLDGLNAALAAGP